MEQYDAIILAGGLGTRLREVIGERPKILAPITKKKFIDILLQKLAESQLFRHVVLALGYQSEQVIEHCQNNDYPFEISYSVESFPLGTAGAIRLALSHNSLLNPIVVFNGDSFSEINIQKAIHQHIQTKAIMTVVTAHVEDTSRYGAIVVEPGTSEILAFTEKAITSGSGWVNAGMYIIKSELLEDLPINKSISLEYEVMPSVVNKGLYAHCIDGYFIDIGTPESLKQACFYLQNE